MCCMHTVVDDILPPTIVNTLQVIAYKCHNLKIILISLIQLEHDGCTSILKLTTALNQIVLFVCLSSIDTNLI